MTRTPVPFRGGACRGAIRPNLKFKLTHYHKDRLGQSGQVSGRNSVRPRQSAISSRAEVSRGASVSPQAGSLQKVAGGIGPTLSRSDAGEPAPEESRPFEERNAACRSSRSHEERRAASPRR